MNIFVLDNDITKAAQYHVDKHVVKMPLESAQMLCTARLLLGESSETVPYRKAHPKHPCTLWATESVDNYLWLCDLGLALCKEYTYRYDKVHKCEAVINDCIDNIPTMPDIGLTPHPQAMDDYCKLPDAVMGYRNYYNNEKHHLFSWKNRPTPYWVTYNEGVTNE